MLCLVVATWTTLKPPQSSSAALDSYLILCSFVVLRACAQGEYASTYGMTACKKCDEGLYQSLTGSLRALPLHNID